MAILKPEREDMVLGALKTDPATATESQSRVAAQTLAREALTANAMAQIPEESFKTEEDRYAAASKMVELMTGEKDLDGRLWNGGKGFKTGAEYLRSVKETLYRGMGAAVDPELQAWMRMTDKEKDAFVESQRGMLSYVGEAAGDLIGAAGEAVRGVPRLSAEEYAAAPADVREASDAMGSVMWEDIPEEERGEFEAKVSDWRGGEWQRLKRRGEYEAKLRRKNALLYLPDMIKSLGTDEAKELAGELAQNPSETPDNWTSRLKELPTRDIETLAQIRGMTREHVEGGFFNWLGDMGIAAYNGARGLLAGMGEQEAKVAAMAMGWDGEKVNEMIRRKHALWSAYAGWSSPVAQLSDEHCAAANFTIGLASAVPFIASMHLKGLGYAACAGEMMSEADAQAAAAGIDVTDPAYVARNALAGGLYAYMLKAVSPKFLGASATGAEEEMALRTAFMKGVMSGISKLDTAKVMSQRTASGALMMAMQQGIAAVNEDLNLGGDAWRDAAERFTETFVSSIPDMLVFSSHGVLEGHARASGGLRKMFTAEGRANRSQNLREAVENAFAVRTAVGVNGRINDLRTNTTLARLAAMRRAWTEGGEKGLGRLGLKPEEIAEAKEFFEAERAAYGAAERLDELERDTDAESLEEMEEDAPLGERNEAARRYGELMSDWARRAERIEEMLLGKTSDEAGVVRDLEAVRNVWAQGHAVGAGSGSRGAEAADQDVGAAALVKAGFAPEDAKILSKAFGAERRGMYSPAATEALRALYTRSTRGQVEATAALASVFKGKVRTEGGRTFIDLPMPGGGTGTLAVEPTDMSQKFFGEAGSDPEMARQVEKRTGGAVKADDWIAMDDAARRRVMKRHHLVLEGDFVAIDPSDPSLHVSSGDADAVMGVIQIDPSADPSAAFHEAWHGFLDFCKRTNFFDEADLKWLTDTYGRPENAREQLDEESAAEGFRVYLAKRMAGAITDEPGPFRKLFGLIGRLRHLREARAATERLAANAEEALYDAFLAGRYQHIRDLKFAEPAAPKAEAGTGSEAPQTGAKPKEEAKETEATEETKGTERAKPAPSGPSAAPAAPRVVSFEALTPTGGKKVRGHYEIVPLGSLLHSNKAGYPMELQQRDRRDNKGEEQTREEHITNFEAGYLLADPKTDSGAMVVARRPGPDGKPQLVVVSGNGRTMVLEEMAKRHLYDKYRNRMKEWAKENGVENAVADDDNPVLVRVVDDLGGATLKELADLSNTNAIQQMNEEEQARADADLVRSLDLAKLYRANMDGTANMAGGASDEFFRAFVRATGDTSLLNSDGTFTEALRMRARRALLAIACGQGERGRDVVKKLVEDTDSLGIDRQKDAAAAIAPHVAATESRPEYAIGPDVSRAFADYIEFRENRDAGKKWGTLEEYLKQGDMLDQRSEIAEAVMRLLDDPKGAPVLAETVRLYAEAAKGEADGLFGAARTRAELWRDAAKAVDPERAGRRYSLAKGTFADYTWATLTAKPDMKLAQIDPEKFKNYKTDAERVADAHRSVIEAGGEKVGENYYIRMEGERVLVGADGIKHRGRKPNLANDFVFPVLGEVLKNAVRVNELEPRADVARDRNITDTFVYLGALAYGHEVLPVRIQVEHRGGERRVDRIDVLRSFNTKIGSAAALGGLAPALQTEPVISISNLIRIAQPLHPTIFSRDVAAALGVDYRGGEIGARYSIAGGVGAANLGLKGAAEAEAMTPEERAVTPPWETEDVPGDRQIVRYSVTAQTETPQFKNFFGDWEKDPENASKVVDKDGKPLVVWHGDKDPSFTVFDKGQIRRGHGFWFAKDQGEAAGYALDAEPRAFFLNIRNPARESDMKGKLLDDYHANGGAGASWKAFIWDRHASEFLRSRGYDGLEFEGKYIAFEPTQIKSATDNTGAFNPRNPDIRYSVTAQRVTPEEDAEYADAVKRGDMETVRRMEREVYERMGYSDDSSYQGTSAFNGAAPGRNAYFESKAERIEATKNGEMEDTTTLGDFRDGIDLNNLQFIVFDPRSERNADPKRQEAIRNIRGVLDGGKDTITMYRSVPADVKEGQFRNGDWITPSRAYAEENARIHGWEKSRIIEQEVSIEDVWWDGNDIAEWGFDDGKGSVYKNTLANRKLLGPTYDDAGNLIPLSKRFNDWKNDVRYSIVSLAGRDVAVVDDLDAARNMNPTMPADVEKYILDHLESGIQMLVGGTASINAETARHFAWSKVRGKYNKSRRMRKARAQSAIVFGDLVKMFRADDTTKQEDYHKQGDEVWKCRLPFGVPQFGNSSEQVAGGIVYDADVIVKDEGGGKFLYDVANLKRNEALTQQLTSQAQDLFGGGKRAAEAVSARAPDEAPTLTAMADLSAETLSQLYERHLTGESATSAPEGTTDSIPKPADEIKGDPESFARRSLVARATEGEAEEKESALVAFVAERALRHGPKPNAIKTIGRLGLEMGLTSVDTGRIIKKGEALAERVRGTVIERAIQNGDVAAATAMLARESDIDNLVAGAAGAGGKLVRSGEGRIKSILDREIEKTVRSFNAASLADVERDTGIDIAGEILANSPEKFDPKGAAKSPEGETQTDGADGADGSAPGEASPGDGNLSDYEIARRQRVRKEAEERVAKMIATAKERSEAAKKEREEWEAKREERKRRAEEAAASGEGGGEGGEGGEGSGGEGGEGAAAGDRPRLSTFADFKTPEEFAAFFRVWAEDRYKKEHGASTLGKHEEKRLFPEFYRKAVVKELQDLADKLLPPKGARATVNRWLGEIQPGVKPDTLERISADVFAYINRNAIREGRTSQIQKFRNGLKAFVKGPQFDDLKLDADRRVTGWVEEAARYIRRVCNLSIRSINGEPSQLDEERQRLQEVLDRREKVYDDEGKNAADAPKFDMETRRALAKLQLLEKYGAMKRYMPGEIADLADEAMRWLNDEAAKLEAAWKEARETEESIRGALAGGIVGPNGQKYRRGDGVGAWFDGLFDSLNGMIRLRLQHLVRFADSRSQQKARDAINRVVVMLGDGEVAFARHLQDDRTAFHNALNEIFTDRATGRFDRRACADWLNRMTEDIPQELSRRLSNQGYADSMTYGQMLQLLVSLEQKSYAEAIRANGRDGQADLIRTFETVGPDGRRERVLTDKDMLFIDWLRSFYEAKRGTLSEVTKRMTGLPIDSPDPLYCPVKMYMGDQARGLHVDGSAAWDPIGAVFSRRVETTRDFDESASVLGQFFDRSAASANLVAWGERGAIIRGVFTDAGVQQTIRLAFGGGELTKILRQLEETFNGGENIKKTPGEIAAADKAMNWMTYLSLGYNPLSAMKQTTSFSVWANALPGGFRDLWRYMTDVDMATIRHIKESEAYRVRYGNEVGSGQDVATKGIFENPSENPVAAFFRKTSMGLLRKGDFLPGGWIAQGVFRDLYNRHLKEGMDADAADRLAMTETFNMLEETQQSGRTYNTAELAREHGRLGRLLVQFATSPLQQLQYETQAAREVRDLMRYRPTTPDADFEKRYSEAKGKLVRAVVINHVLLPAALHAVTNLYRLAMGYEPEWEKEGWHWTMLRDITLGQFSRVFFIGAISTVTTDVLITGKPVRDIPALIPAEGVVKLFGNITVTARDVATLNYDRVKKDLDRLMKSTSITRTPYDIIRRLTGNSDVDRKKKEKSK